LGDIAGLNKDGEETRKAGENFAENRQGKPQVRSPGIALII
jgi:hypothetical protein